MPTEFPEIGSSPSRAIKSVGRLETTHCNRNSNWLLVFSLKKDSIVTAEIWVDDFWQLDTERGNCSLLITDVVCAEAYKTTIGGLQVVLTLQSGKEIIVGKESHSRVMKRFKLTEPADLPEGALSIF